MDHVQEKTGVFLVTVDQLQNYDIVEYYGLVHGKAIYGAGFVKDFFARVADKVGGRVSGYERSLGGAMVKAATEMAKTAEKLGANAVIGISHSTTAVGGSMLMASCIGTAVQVRARDA